ncbi:MAG: replicative DNA helicase [Stomatobaculum sp.]|nr:replicative DNA helicase [Stomatobaculum sp.]
MAEENLLKRVLPHSLEAEQSVLGAMLMDKDAVAAALEICSPDDFYSRQYGAVFECMAELFDEGKPVDMITVQAKLKEKDVPPEVSEIEFIRRIFDYNPTSANVKSYAGIVHEKAVKRRLIKVNEEIENRCYADTDGMDELLSETEEKVFRILESRGAAEIRSIEQVTVNVMERIQEAYMKGGSVAGIPTGFIDLDQKTAGLQPSDLVLVAARPSMGKTAFVLNILEHAALKKGLKCMIFSLEMSSEQLVNRMLSMESGIDAQKMRTGQLTSADFEQLLEAAVRVSGASNLVIDDSPLASSVAEIRSRCRKQKLEHGLDLVIIDYLQLMSGNSKKNDNRQQEISEISRNLKALAREIKAPVVALSQLSRACEQRQDHRPMLSDLRESGAIEQDADVVMFLYRDDYYNKDTEHPNEAEVIIAKQRNGPIGTVNLVWKPETTKFVNMAR